MAQLLDAGHADLWDQIVGIPVEDWARADTTVQFDWLLYLRDNPMPTPPVHVLDEVDYFAWGSGAPIATKRRTCC